MNSPIITWYIYDNSHYIQEEDYYLGSFNSDSEITIVIQVWNNRYGAIDVENIENARFVFYFDSLEDSKLLEYCTVAVNNEETFITPEIELNRAIVNIGDLSGEKNDGLETVANQGNYKNVIIKFNVNSKMRNGLKNLYLDIEID